MVLDPKLREQLLSDVGRLPESKKHWYSLQILLEEVKDDGDFIEEFVKIKNKQKQLIPFKFWRPQRILEEEVRNLEAAGKRVLLVILKARQLGCSLWVQARFMMKILRNSNTNALVIADKDINSKNLFNLGNGILLSLPYRPKRNKSNKEEIKFDDPLGSYYACETAQNIDAGRSHTIHHLHASEAASWPYPDVLLRALNPTLVNELDNWIIYESTAKGFGNFFHRKWLMAERGESDFRPVFIGWWQSEDYLLKKISLESQVMERIIERGNLDNEEITLAKAAYTF